MFQRILCHTQQPISHHALLLPISSTNKIEYTKLNTRILNQISKFPTNFDTNFHQIFDTNFHQILTQIPMEISI